MSLRVLALAVLVATAAACQDNPSEPGPTPSDPKVIVTQDANGLVIQVDIDIKPGNDPNSINCNNENETIAVAILSTDDFDATTVDHTTVTFEGASETHVDENTGSARRHEEDVDGDGDTDLVSHFRLGDTDLTCESTEGKLEGETFDGQAIEGTDAVRMINRGGGNDPPTADAGPDQTLEWEQGLTVTLDGSGSSDPDGDPLTYEWTDSDGDVVGTTAQVTVSLSGLGDHTFTLTVTDPSGATDSDDVTITVEDTTPTADAGPDQTLEWEQGLTVTLDGSGSSDPDGDPLTYEWTDSDGDVLGTTVQVTVSLSGLGDHTFTLTVTDPSGATDSDDVTITVEAAAAPSSIPAPGFQPSGLAFDGTFLYLSELSGPRPIFRLDPTTGAVLGSSPLCPCAEFSSPNASPNGMVFDGAGRLLVSNIGTFGAGAVFEIDVAGTTVLNSFSLPFRGGAIAFDGTNIYISDFDGSQILVTDRSGAFVRTFSSGLRPAGMVFDPTTGHLWVISEFDKKISEITTQGDLIRQCDGPREPGIQGLGGVTLVGSELYIAEVSDPDPFNPPNIPGTIFIVDLRTLTCDPPN